MQKRKSLVSIMFMSLFAVLFASCNEHEHSWNSDFKTDGTHHWHECADSECNEVNQKEAHTGGTATCTSLAKCLICNVEYGKLADHNYNRQDTKEDYLKSEATCTSKASYYLSCECGAKGMETFEVGEVLDHVFDQEVVSADFLANVATHTTKAVYYKSCICGAKDTETFESGDVLSEHAYNQEVVSEQFLKSEATCEAKATYFKSCICGEKGTETFETGDKLAHTFDQSVVDDKYLANVATCTSNATYYLSCKCGEKGTETFETGEFLPHTFDGQVATDEYLKSEADCQNKAVYYVSCSVCQTKGTETFVYGEFGNHQMGGYQADNNQHWKECTVAGCEHKTEVVGHTGGNPTCNVADECEECGYSYKTAHNYVDVAYRFSQAINDWLADQECSVCHTANSATPIAGNKVNYAGGTSFMTGYRTLADAMEDMFDNLEYNSVTIKLNARNTTEDTIVIPTGKTVTLNMSLNYTLSANKIIVEKGATLKFEATSSNSKLICTSNVANSTFIENYGTIKLDGITLDASENANVDTVIANYYGMLLVKESSEILASTGKTALKVLYGYNAECEETFLVEHPQGDVQATSVVSFDATFDGRVSGKVVYGRADTVVNASEWSNKVAIDFSSAQSSYLDITFDFVNLEDYYPSIYSPNGECRPVQNGKFDTHSWILHEEAADAANHYQICVKCYGIGEEAAHTSTNHAVKIDYKWDDATESSQLVLGVGCPTCGYAIVTAPIDYSFLEKGVFETDGNYAVIKHKLTAEAIATILGVDNTIDENSLSTVAYTTTANDVVVIVNGYVIEPDELSVSGINNHEFRTNLSDGDVVKIYDKEEGKYLNVINTTDTEYEVEQNGLYHIYVNEDHDIAMVRDGAVPYSNYQIFVDNLDAPYEETEANIGKSYYAKWQLHLTVGSVVVIKADGTQLGGTYTASKEGEHQFYVTNENALVINDPDNLNETINIEYLNVDGWDYVNVYAWSDASGTTEVFTGGWPGTMMQGYGNSWYTLELEAKSFEGLKVKFNCGTNETKDLLVDRVNGLNPYFVGTMDRGYSSEHEAIQAYSSLDENSFYITGDFNNWNLSENLIQLLINYDGTALSYNMYLEANSALKVLTEVGSEDVTLGYQEVYKCYRNDEFEGMIEDSTIITTDGQNNKIVAVAQGVYLFEINANGLTITYNPHEHNQEKGYGDEYSAQESNCYYEGYISHNYCGACDKYFVLEGGQYVEKTREEVYLPITHQFGDEHPAVDSCFDTCNIPYYQCGDCGDYFVKEGDAYVGKEYNEIFSDPTHDYSVFTAAKAPTCLENGNIAYYKCPDCNHYFDENKDEIYDPTTGIVVSSLGHEIDNANYSFDETHHYYSCMRCSYIEENTKVTHAIEGVCGCGYDTAGHQCVFENEYAYDKYLVSAATCTEAAAYYKSCACGKASDSLTFETEALGHEQNYNWKNDGTQHWCECGRSGCNEIIVAKEAHNWTAWALDSYASCSICGYSSEEVLQEITLYVVNNAGWQEIAVHAWIEGGANFTGNWPGKLMEQIGTSNVYKVTLKVSEASEEVDSFYGLNVIFNNNNNQEQTATIPVDATQLYFTVSKDSLGYISYSSSSIIDGINVVGGYNFWDVQSGSSMQYVGNNIYETQIYIDETISESEWNQIKVVFGNSWNVAFGEGQSNKLVGETTGSYIVRFNVSTFEVTCQAVV